MTEFGRPAGLKARGRRFWDDIVAVYELAPHERELVAELARLLDEADQLRRAVQHDGTTVLGSKDQVRLHPALGELRATRLAFARILAQLGLPDEDDQAMKSGHQLRGVTGARARWGKPGAGNAAS